MNKRTLKSLKALKGLLLQYDSGHQSRHAAGVVRKGKLISVGFNQRKSHTLAVRYSGSHLKNCIHAELDAIKRARETQGLDMVVLRLNRQGQEMMSKPCPACMRMIGDSGISRVLYTTQEGYEIIHRGVDF